jgi:hypothetical protein
VKLKNYTNIEQYERKVQAVTAPGAISVDVLTTTLAVDGTDAYTMAAPKFAGQFKHIVIISGANTPVANITVTGMRIPTQDVWSMATFVAATAPRAITFYSPDGVVWDVWATVGTVTVA